MFSTLNKSSTTLLNTAKIQKTCQNTIFLAFYDFVENFPIFALHK
jgi:hypothetical protein